jgi:hypothetical protein
MMGGATVDSSRISDIEEAMPGGVCVGSAAPMGDSRRDTLEEELKRLEVLAPVFL